MRSFPRAPTESPLVKYGYQVWFSADTKRFSLRGLRGQYVLVDPDLKLVLVQTDLASSDSEFSELFALWTALRAQVKKSDWACEPEIAF